MAFKKIIQGLRRQEITDYVKLSVGRAFQRALGNCTSIMAGFICFLFMHFTGSGSELTLAKIFSTMELMVTTRLLVFELGMAIGFYYELKVIFERFTNIYNIADKRMILIDEDTKEPVLGNLNP